MRIEKKGKLEQVDKQSNLKYTNNKSDGCNSKKDSNKKLSGIEIFISDEDNTPLKDISVALCDQNKITILKTNANGIVCFNGLEQKEYVISLHTMDQKAWKIDKEETVTDASKFNNEKTAEWKDKVQWENNEKKNLIADTYSVKQGDSLSKIAANLGFLSNTIWKDSGNNNLKNKRENHNILLPGDSIVIPEKKIKFEKVNTGKKYSITRMGLIEVLNVKLEAFDKPIADIEYYAKFKLSNGDVIKDAQGKTDKDGHVHLKVRPDITSIDLKINENGKQYSFSLNVSYIDPVETVSGIQGLLYNLGYYDGELNGKLDDNTIHAIALYQLENDLQATGALDDAFTKSITSQAFFKDN